ncbi:MAG: CYCXC family (seleno)protein [Acidobacteriota bacterium]
MNKKLIAAILVLLGAGVLVVKYWRPAQTGEPMAPSTNSSNSQPEVPQLTSNATRPVPAHYENPPEALPSTLSPDKFPGKTRQAYQAAKDIPQTLAQLPCYCYCDRGMGHKSLHSCFEDDHAAHCDVCVNEAIMAYQMQKQGMTPAQIREQLIAKYSQQ